MHNKCNLWSCRYQIRGGGGGDGGGDGGGGEGRRWGVGWFQEGFIGFIVIIILVGELNP